MTIKRGDTVRVTSNLTFVDGASVAAGTVFTVARRFDVRTRDGKTEPRLSLADVILRTVRLEDVEKQ